MAVWAHGQISETEARHSREYAHVSFDSNTGADEVTEGSLKCGVVSIAVVSRTAWSCGITLTLCCGRSE